MKKKKRDEQILRHAFFAGIITFILIFPLAILEYYRSKNVLTPALIALTILSNATYLLVYTVFMRGFLKIASLFKNKLLAILSYTLMSIETFTVLYTIILLFFPATEKPLIVSLELTALGIAVILFGIAVTQLKKLETLARATGITQMLTGISYLLTPRWGDFAYVAIILFILGSILEITLLYKAWKKY